MTGFAQLLDDLPVLRGTEKGRNVRDIKWLADRFGQRAYTWNLKMPHNQVKSKRINFKVNF